MEKSQIILQVHQQQEHQHEISNTRLNCMWLYQTHNYKAVYLTSYISPSSKSVIVQWVTCESIVFLSSILFLLFFVCTSNQQPSTFQPETATGNYEWSIKILGHVDRYIALLLSNKQDLYRHNPLGKHTYVEDLMCLSSQFDKKLTVFTNGKARLLLDLR